MAESALKARVVGMISLIVGDKKIKSKSFPLPVACLMREDFERLIDYMKSDRLPKADIRFSHSLDNDDHPGLATKVDSEHIHVDHFTKPDVCAIGEDVLVANSELTEVGKRHPYSPVSGTSMATAAVAGAVAHAKSLHPDWSANAIKSALMTTSKAMKMNKLTNVKLCGSGLIDIKNAADPGLVYDISEDDYIRLLRGQGCSDHDLAQCAGMKKLESIGSDSIQPCDLNYPWFKASLSDLKHIQVFRRKLKYVGLQKMDDKIYRAHLNYLEGFEIEITPSELHFVDGCQEKDFKMHVNVTDWSKAKENLFPAVLEWKSKKYTVRSQIIIARSVIDEGESGGKDKLKVQEAESNRNDKGKDIVEEFKEEEEDLSL